VHECVITTSTGRIVFRKACRLSRAEARRIVANVAKLPELSAKAVKLLASPAWDDSVTPIRSGGSKGLCQMRMGRDPIDRIFFRTEFSEIILTAIGPRYQYAPNVAAFHRRQNGAL
jgi:hypothetical protein